MIIEYSPNDIVRFWKHVDIKGADECWNWKIAKDKDGYGKFKITSSKRIDIGAHRFSYIISKGNIENNLYVCHSCDNPSCVNPNHLWVGTNQENQMDYINKGFYDYSNDYKKVNCGENNGRAKIAFDDVKKIRIDYFIPSIKVSDLSKKYHLSKTQIRNIATGKSWATDGYSSTERRTK